MEIQKKILHQLPNGYFQCVITSPPYWGQRDYNNPNQIGLERTLDEYINDISSIFDLVSGLLAKNGTIWLNMGDAYTSGNRKYRAYDKKNPARAMNYRPDTPPGLKKKDLIGLPWRVAFEIQKKGYYLRNDIIWHKPNAMPESVKDRPYRNHEYLFLFSKSERYYFDNKGLLEENGKSRRSVWEIKANYCKGLHCATFPEELIEPCILSSTKKGDWILDPFFGSGTVGLVCERLGRNYVGIEINEDYVRLSNERLSKYKN